MIQTTDAPTAYAPDTVVHAPPHAPLTGTFTNAADIRAQIMTAEAEEKALKDKRAGLYNQLFRISIHNVRGWMPHLSDPEIHDVGEQFADKLRDSRCKTGEVSLDLSCITSYASFSYADNNAGFVNKITYGPAALDCDTQLFSSDNHEALHALQTLAAPALHASPFNPATRIIICPRDWVALQERCEQDAFAKQAWLNSLLAQSDPAAATSRRDLMTGLEFDAIRNRCDSLAATLQTAAATVLQKSFYSDAPDSPRRFVHYYQENALENYRNGMIGRTKKGEANLIFVRLDPEDLHAVGDSFGPNSFGADSSHPALHARTALSPDAQDSLERLNKSLGIINEDALPTLSEALATFGLNKTSLLIKSFDDVSYDDQRRHQITTRAQAARFLSTGTAQNNTPAPWPPQPAPYWTELAPAA